MFNRNFMILYTAVNVSLYDKQTFIFIIHMQTSIETIGRDMNLQEGYKAIGMPISELNEKS